MDFSSPPSTLIYHRGGVSVILTQRGWALRVSTGRTGTPNDKELEDAKLAVQAAVKTLAEREFVGLFEEIAFDPKKAGNGNLCIVLDFYDDKISVKTFESAVYKIGKTALGAITAAKKGENNG